MNNEAGSNAPWPWSSSAARSNLTVMSNEDSCYFAPPQFRDNLEVMAVLNR